MTYQEPRLPETVIERAAEVAGPFLGIPDWKLRNAAAAALSAVTERRDPKVEIERLCDVIDDAYGGDLGEHLGPEWRDAFRAALWNGLMPLMDDDGFVWVIQESPGE